MKTAALFAIAALSATIAIADGPANPPPVIDGFRCDYDAAACSCEGPATSQACQTAIQYCTGSLVCPGGGATCTCPYNPPPHGPGFLGGARRW
jgi:hypothetical protein